MPHRVAVIRDAAERADQSRAVIGTDLSGTVVYWNAEAERLYGWPSAEAMGRDILELTPTMMSKNEAGDIMRTLLEGKPWTGPFMVRDRSGHPMIVHVEDLPVIDDDIVIGIVGISRLTSVV